MDIPQTLLTYATGLFILYIVPNIAVKSEEVKNIMGETGLNVTIFIARVLIVLGFAMFINYAVPEKEKLYWTSRFIFLSVIFIVNDMIYGNKELIKKLYK